MFVADIAHFVGVAWLLFNKIYLSSNVLCYRSSRVTPMRSVGGGQWTCVWVGFWKATLSLIKRLTLSWYVPFAPSHSSFLEWGGETWRSSTSLIIKKMKDDKTEVKSLGYGWQHGYAPLSPICGAQASCYREELDPFLVVLDRLESSPMTPIYWQTCLCVIFSL